MAGTLFASESVDRFCYQYLQLEPTLEYPTAEVIRETSAQETIYKKLFSDEAPRYSPPARYRLRVLKELVARIESSIEDWDQHEVSEDLMMALSESLANPIPSEVSSAQQKSYVTYHLSGLEQSPRPQHSPPPDIILLEARSLISASGTTGLRTWEAALHLGQFLCEDPNLVKGKRVLELGAASDGSDDVINNLPESFFLNELQEKDQKWNNGESVDVVIGADITYDQSIIPALIATVEELFALFPAVQVLISATQRNEVTFEAFCSRCRQREMGLSYVDFPIPPREQQKGPFYNDSVPIRICRLSAPPTARALW
ncbi:uncharacterized protein N0V96_011641 [Colletotrichum fioriniae]|uniref:uncharacterized protein n=1 Tax=Colletotrichum fioriniae TaxID=710243 RepID=UPI0032DB1E68|nr:hypothetical protein N0V96_011641 [Colletotrichum fioriniae]